MHCLRSLRMHGIIEYNDDLTKNANMQFRYNHPEQNMQILCEAKDLNLGKKPFENQGLRHFC